MSEARPEIIELEFPEPVTASTQVRKLLATVEHYRSEGRSLREIYSALVKQKHLKGCQWRTFEKTYYRVRQASPSDENSSDSV